MWAVGMGRIAVCLAGQILCHKSSLYSRIVT